MNSIVNEQAIKKQAYGKMCDTSKVPATPAYLSHKLRYMTLRSDRTPLRLLQSTPSIDMYRNVSNDTGNLTTKSSQLSNVSECSIASSYTTMNMSTPLMVDSTMLSPLMRKYNQPLLNKINQLSTLVQTHLNPQMQVMNLMDNCDENGYRSQNDVKRKHSKTSTNFLREEIKMLRTDLRKDIHEEVCTAVRTWQPIVKYAEAGGAKCKLDYTTNFEHTSTKNNKPVGSNSIVLKQPLAPKLVTSDINIEETPPIPATHRYSTRYSQLKQISSNVVSQNISVSCNVGHRYSTRRSAMRLSSGSHLSSRQLLTPQDNLSNKRCGQDNDSSNPKRHRYSTRLSMTALRNTTLLSARAPNVTTRKSCRLTNKPRKCFGDEISPNSYLENTLDLSSKSEKYDQEKSDQDVKRVQLEHYDFVLNILAKGSAKQLQSLPAIGQKTAIVIYNYRLNNKSFKKISDLNKVPGLSKNFVKKFLLTNNVNIDV